MKKYYNFETMFKTLKDALKLFLNDNGIYFEISANGKYYHFEILANATQADAINRFLNNNAIYCCGIK